MKPYSLTRRLLTTVLLAEMFSALALSAVALVHERNLRFHAFDIMLRGRADSLLGAVQDAEDTQDNVMLDGSQALLPAEDIYQVRDASGRILGQSSNWTGSPGLAAANGAFFPLALHGKEYRSLKIEGTRIVDPGDKGGGIPRRVTILYGAPIDGVWSDIWKAAGFYAAAAISLLAFSGFLIFWFLDRGLAPLRALAAEAAGVNAHQWNFSPPPRARRVRELAPLTSALERLLTGLEHSFQQQRRFVSDAAHELKTAVAVLKSSLQLLTLKPRSAQEYALGIERCQLDCMRVEETVAKMLTLARVETVVDAADQGCSTDVGLVLRQVAQQLETMAELKRLQIEVSDEEPPPVEVDPEQLRILLANLLLNAVQHSPAGATIRASVRGRGEAAEIIIEDQGDGIAAQDLPHIFERFYRGDPSRSRMTGGTGLGLAICRAIVWRWRGTIDISSQLGQGATVTVVFPASASDNRPAFSLA